MNMHWCTCRVNLAGQGFNIIEFYPAKPVSWPEVQVLMALHGDENVYEIKAVGVGETSMKAEKDRLISIYDVPIVEQCYPGRVFHMEMMMPGEQHNQRRVGDDGAPIVMAADDDDGPIPEPTTDAVFKPGKHRPAAGA